MIVHTESDFITISDTTLITLTSNSLPSQMKLQLVIGKFNPDYIGEIYPLVKEYHDDVSGEHPMLGVKEHEVSFNIGSQSSPQWVATINKHYLSEVIYVLHVYHQMFTGQLRG
jgi:hypothetical protein